MSKMICSGLMLLLASAASAGTFTVTLHNGNSFDSRYQPKAASWDENVILVLDEFGNWVGLDRADVKSVISDIEARGYGIVIDTTTKEFGFAPNDAALPDEKGGAQTEAAPTALDRILNQNYDTPQFVEPGSSGGGFPVFNVGASGSGGGGGGTNPVPR